MRYATTNHGNIKHGQSQYKLHANRMHPLGAEETNQFRRVTCARFLSAERFATVNRRNSRDVRRIVMMTNTKLYILYIYIAISMMTTAWSSAPRQHHDYARADGVKCIAPSREMRIARKLCSSANRVRDSQRPRRVDMHEKLFRVPEKLVSIRDLI